MSTAEPRPSYGVSASDYAESVRDEFKANAPKKPASHRTSPKDRRSGQTVKAGPNADIVVDRALTREERKALQDIGRVIEHLLNK